MSLASGARLGPYEIQSALGAGGIGEVYRAKDTRLGRTVAIKVLPADLAASPERRGRFEQEARAVSALNHPHICTLYDIGSATPSGEPGAPPTDFLVMEHLDGQTLAARLEKGPLPVREVLEVGAQVAGALAVAHRHGVLHRDVEPGNVMLTKAGAKLLDFGLAKARPGTGALDDGQTMSVTRGPLTSAGLVMGTVPYMAPEVLEGKEADARLDIFALGAMHYEMVAGRRPFSGESQASLIAAILTAEPTPLTELATVTPPALDRLIRRCLAKDPDDRWQSVGDIARQLEGLAEDLRLPTSGTQTDIAVAGPPASWRRRAVWATLGVIALAAVGSGAYILAPRNAARPQPTFHRLTFRQGNVGSARFAADGRSVIYTAQWEGRLPETFTVRADGVDSEPRDSLGDRSVIAVSSRNEVAMLRGSTLATAPLTGGAPKEVADLVGSNVIAPDGRHFLCGNNIPDDYWLYLCEIDGPVGAAPPRYVDGSKWRAVGWMANGRKLLVRDFAPGIARHLFLLDPATGAARPWKEIGGHLDPAGLAGINRIYFRADGERYAYQFQRQLTTLSVANGVK